MINFRNVNKPNSLLAPERWLGKLLRAPLRLIPKSAVLPIIQGPGRGLRWIVGSYNHGCWLGSYEYEKQIAVRDLVRAGDVVYDIGAHVGYFTIILSRLVGPHSAVYSFEPFEANYAYLVKHLALNEVANVIAVRAAIGPATGVGHLESGLHSSMGRLSDQQGIECPVYNLVECIREKGWRAPTLIKIDIEGEEARVVPGLIDYVVEVGARLLISTHSVEITRTLTDLLEERGFRVTPLQWARQPGTQTLETASLILATA